MSIVKNHYFRNEIFLPKANPSITDDITAIPADLIDFINEYEEDCLIKCFGTVLYNSLKNEFDFAQENLLKTTAAQKWDDLLNGKQNYTNREGKTVSWRGIRFKGRLDGTGQYDKSFIANYVYFFHEQNNQSTRGSVGHQKNDPKNATVVSARPKAVRAWRKFVEMVQGPEANVAVYTTNLGIGVDYYTIGEHVTLYEFVKDMNFIDPTTYPDFAGKNWVNINQFDL